MKEFRYNSTSPYIMLFIDNLTPYFTYDDCNAIFEHYLERNVRVSKDILIVSTINNEDSLIYKQNKRYNLGILFINEDEYDKIDKSKYKYVLYLGGMDALILKDLGFESILNSVCPTTMAMYNNTINDVCENKLFRVRCMDKNIYPNSFFKSRYSQEITPDYENDIFVVYEYPITTINETDNEITIIKDNLDPLI